MVSVNNYYIIYYLEQSLQVNIVSYEKNDDQ